MADDMAALVIRLARLELALAEEREARERDAAEAAAVKQRLERLGRELSDGLGRLDARLLAVAERQGAAETGLDAARTWLGDLTAHLEAAQKEANGWAEAEQEARTALEQSFWTVREQQEAAAQAAASRPAQEAALRAEVTALGHLVEDLSAAVFAAPDGQA